MIDHLLDVLLFVDRLIAPALVPSMIITLVVSFLLWLA